MHGLKSKSIILSIASSTRTALGSWQQWVQKFNTYIFSNHGNYVVILDYGEMHYHFCFKITWLWVRVVTNMVLQFYVMWNSEDGKAVLLQD
jgi:hypothetical protein